VLVARSTGRAGQKARPLPGQQRPAACGGKDGPAGAGRRTELRGGLERAGVQQQAKLDGKKVLLSFAD
jgi:hypothetical protein